MHVKSIAVVRHVRIDGLRFTCRHLGSRSLFTSSLSLALSNLGELFCTRTASFGNTSLRSCLRSWQSAGVSRNRRALANEIVRHSAANGALEVGVVLREPRTFAMSS